MLKRNLHHMVVLLTLLCAMSNYACAKNNAGKTKPRSKNINSCNHLYPGKPVWFDGFHPRAGKVAMQGIILGVGEGVASAKIQDSAFPELSNVVEKKCSEFR